jgi:hypothetical protein
MTQIPPRRPFGGSAVAVSLNLVIGNAQTSQRIQAVNLLSQRQRKLQRRRFLLLAFVMTLFAGDPIAGRAASSISSPDRFD